ncbi:TrbC/VirB2 family protein [Citrobacter sp. JGM124]|uniref:TrbC/VirB2 family protein n=1 Tax=Citrobacter sp. JGM124 TaxID=2799789 RepID=UPI001BA94D07|nr:TrbC/VirB2 family protein [Citrobacter sp. JGM124]MBS0847043.1 TrbC/VirB2 family protein [Citrobacter sp. JGM124]
MLGIRVSKNNRIRPAAVSASAALPLPALADGFSKAERLLEKISAGLTGLAIVTITIAVIWVGYKVLWDGKSLHDCKGIIIGGILIASGAEIGALLMS